MFQYLCIIFTLHCTFFEMNKSNYDLLMDIMQKTFFPAKAANSINFDKISRAYYLTNANNIHLLDWDPAQLEAYQRLIMNQLILFHTRIKITELNSLTVWKLCIFYGLVCFLLFILSILI